MVRQHLVPGLSPYDRLEVSHYHRVGVRPNDASDYVVGGINVCNPVPDGLIDCVFQRAAPRVHRAHLGTQQAHPEDVEGLPSYIFLTHVHHALLLQHGADGGCGHAVLSGPGFRDDPVLSHALGKEALSEHVVYLMGARVGEVFAFQVYARPTKLPGQVLGVVERRWPPRVVLSQAC